MKYVCLKGVEITVERREKLLGVNHQSKNGNGIGHTSEYYKLDNFCPKEFPAGTSIRKWNGWTGIEAEVNYTGVKPIAVLDFDGKNGHLSNRDCNNCEVSGCVFKKVNEDQ